MQAAGAVLGIAGGAMSAAGERQAINKAEKENRARVMMDNQRLEQLHREMRGEKGFATMPLYATRDGKPFEPTAFQDALKFYEYFNQNPTDVESEYKAIIDKYKPLQQKVANMISDGVFGGGLKNEELAAFAPVESARVSMANVRRNSFTDAVNRQIAQLRAFNARRGFGGDSYARNLLEMEARRRGSEAGSMDMAQANLQNAMDRAKITGADIARRLSSTSAPSSLLQTESAWNEIPRNVAGTRWQNALGTVSPFQIGTSQPGMIQQPFVQPKATNLMIGGAALSSLGGAMSGGMFGGMGGGGGGNSFSGLFQSQPSPVNNSSPMMFRGAGSMAPAPATWTSSSMPSAWSSGSMSPWMFGGSGLNYGAF